MGPHCILDEELVILTFPSSADGVTTSRNVYAGVLKQRQLQFQT